MEKSKKKIFLGGAILGLGAFFAKFLGAVYRIPLTRVLKSSGLGIYQMVFPVYTLLLDFSGLGVPNALSKLIASKKKYREQYAELYLKKCIKIFYVLGLIGSLFMLIFSYPMSVAQGNKDAYLGYIFLSPSVFLVCLICSYRGYFQGLSDMKPTAFSQILEQAVKLLFGLFFASLFMPNLKLAVGGATFAITLSELVAYIFLRIKKSKHRIRNISREISVNGKEIINAVIPITLVGVIIPFSGVLDTFIVVNLLSRYADNATSLYGLYSGVCMTVISLPVSMCYGIAVASVPSVSSSGNINVQKQRTRYSLILTFSLSLIAGVGIYFLSPYIIQVLFSSLVGEEKQIAIRLLKAMSPIVVLLSFLQTENAILIAKGKYYFPIIGTVVGITVKTVIEFLLIKQPSYNIFGCAISLIACYFVADLINFILLTFIGEKNANKEFRYFKLQSSK